MFSKIKKVIPAPLRQKARRILEELRTYKKYKMASFLVGVAEVIIGRYITFHTRPKCSTKVFIDIETVASDYSAYAIVVQGPVMKKDNFTLETVLLYKKYFPNSLIVLSTWEGEDEYCVEQAKRACVEVILNKKPQDTGPINVNLQIVSSGSGVKRAVETNRKYTLKTRTDQRFYNCGSLSFLSNLIKFFPIGGSGSVQKGRLVGISINNSKKKLYHFPDQFVFGYTEDVLLYFGAGMAFSNITLDFLEPHAPFTAEGYLLAEFLKKVGYKIECTYADYMKVLAKHCIIVDAASLDLYWHKYRRFCEYRNASYKDKHLFIGFLEWFNLYSLYN